MFLVNSRSESLTAPSLIAETGRPYPEVTAAVLPNSLTRVLPFTLVYSTYPPVLVLVRILLTKNRDFSWKLESSELSSPKGKV